MLRVPGSYSRGRSPSPGGKHRHRSHSRKHSPSRERSKSRSKTSSSKHHYDSDSMDDRPRAPASRSSTKKRYDLDLSDDDRYKSDYKSDYKNDYKSDRGRRAPRDRHYLSDEESVAGPRQSNTSLRSDRSDRYSHDTGAERSQRSTSRALRPLAKTQYYSDLYSDSEDEGLAYGDIYSDYPVSSGERRSRSRERVRKPKKFYDSDSSDEIQEPAPRTKDPPPKYRPHDSKSSKLGRSHSQKYYSAATNALAAKLQEAKSYFAEKPQNTGSGINEDEWAEIPECERPDFVPPDRRNQGYTASTSMNNQPGAPPPPPAPLPPATSQMPNSNYAYSQPHPPITPNKAGEPVRVLAIPQQFLLRNMFRLSITQI
ncbi:predicted protein [Uncinocarpus reesii 1704]|uniref:Uncharacterized protein n=1 Tax=Uncinocarpus reesii (strain UAMH 1704) TaxID=336963 RepID=C4JE03_UNCRE|nr:uncharacterized protein UREG_00427 [Uncinocarpus reesii 1704]EEP75581.1 predicted protein [Uncinocarpus reesii 1704]